MLMIEGAGPLAWPARHGLLGENVPQAQDVGCLAVEGVLEIPPSQPRAAREDGLNEGFTARSRLSSKCATRGDLLGEPSLDVGASRGWPDRRGAGVCEPVADWRSDQVMDG